MTGDEAIPRDEYQDILAEKRLITAWAQNQWPGEIAENLYSLHGHWLDEDDQEDVESDLQEIRSSLDHLESNFEKESGGYDTEAIRSLSIEERKNMSRQLNRNTNKALDIINTIFDRVEGHHDITDHLPDLINESVNNAVEEAINNAEFLDIDADTYVDHITRSVEATIEENIDSLADEETLYEVRDQIGDSLDSIYDEARTARQNTETLMEGQRQLKAGQDEILTELDGGSTGGSGRRDDTYGVGIFNIFDSEEKSRRGYIRDAALAGTFLTALGLGYAELTDEETPSGNEGPNNGSAYDPGPVEGSYSTFVHEVMPSLNESQKQDIFDNADNIDELVDGNLGNTEVGRFVVDYNPGTDKSSIRYQIRTDTRPSMSGKFDVKDETAKQIYGILEGEQ